MIDEEKPKEASAAQTAPEDPLSKIPSKYRDLPADLAEELWQQPVAIDSEKAREQAAERARGLEALRGRDLQVATQENADLTRRLESFGEGGADTKTAQEKVAADFIAPLLRADSFPEEAGLSLAESNVLAKMTEAYKKAKAEKPNEPVKFQFSKPADQLVYNNLIARRALEGLKNDRVKNDELAREKVTREVEALAGIPPAEKSRESSLVPEAFGKFSFKNGETAEGAFWNEYSNEAAKQLKKEGKFEWGKERIYLDIPSDRFEQVRDVVMRVATEQNIAIQFKYLDEVKSFDTWTKDPETTKFVANFASARDAKRFYEAVSKAKEYAELLSTSSGQDYKGHRLDAVAQYASGFREARAPLERAANAKRQPDGSYVYQYPILVPDRSDPSKPEAMKEEMRTNRLTEAQYLEFKKRYDDMDPKRAWEKA